MLRVLDERTHYDDGVVATLYWDSQTNGLKLEVFDGTEAAPEMIDVEPANWRFALDQPHVYERMVQVPAKGIVHALEGDIDQEQVEGLIEAANEGSLTYIPEDWV